MHHKKKLTDINHDDDDRPGVAMFEKLFSTNPLPSSLKERSLSHKTSLSSAERKTQAVDGAPSRSPARENHQGQFGSTSLPEYEDEVDEISILGIDLPDFSFESRHRHRTPDGYVDDISMKMESPGNLSIERLLEEEDERHNNITVRKTSPQQIVFEKTLLPSQISNTAVDDFLHEKPPEEETLWAPQQAADGGDDQAHDGKVDFRDQDQVLGDPSPSTRDPSPIPQPPSTPRNLHQHLPYADAEYINTPARPMEDLQYLFDLPDPTPDPETLPQEAAKDIRVRTPCSPSSNVRFLPNSEKTELVQIKQTLAVPQPADELSFATTVADMTIEQDDTLGIDPEPREQSPKRLSNISAATTPHIADRTSMPIVSTPKSSRTLGRVMKIDDVSQKKLGSAIRMGKAVGQSPRSAQGRGTERPLILSTTTFSLVTPQNVRREFVSATEPVARVTRPVTPPTRNRKSMDIPLSRPDPSIELWENPSPIIRLIASRSVSPELPPPKVTETPPARLRQKMDIPERADQSSTEIWHEPHPHPHRRPRRTLLSPDPRRGTLRTSAMLVVESPQGLGIEDFSMTPARAQEDPRTLPKIPKLDFSALSSLKPSKSTTVGDNDDYLPSRSKDENLFAQTDDTSMDVLQKIDDMDVASHRRRQMSALATPRSSKLRHLARRLAEDREAELSNVDVIALASPELTPRSSRRKQLSDDISLDFSETPALDAAGFDEDWRTSAPQDVSLGEHEMQTAQQGLDQLNDDGTVLAEELRSPTPDPISTPVFTLRRNPREPLPGSAPGDLTEVNGKARHRLIQASMEDEPVHMVEKLAVFGVLPQVLPRSKRERKRPAEYWKVQDHKPKCEPSANVAVLPTYVNKRKRVESTQGESDFAQQPLKRSRIVDTEAKRHEPVLLPPVSRRTVHKASDPKVTARQQTTRKIARIHNFEDSD